MSTLTHQFGKRPEREHHSGQVGRQYLFENTAIGRVTGQGSRGDTSPGDDDIRGTDTIDEIPPRFTQSLGIANINRVTIRRDRQCGGQFVEYMKAARDQAQRRTTSSVFDCKRPANAARRACDDNASRLAQRAIPFRATLANSSTWSSTSDTSDALPIIAPVVR